MDLLVSPLPSAFPKNQTPSFQTGVVPDGHRLHIANFMGEMIEDIGQRGTNKTKKQGTEERRILVCRLSEHARASGIPFHITRVAVVFLFSLSDSGMPICVLW